jgi:prolyl-tRNA editing enzyme YbaK/EbsC (Cys-tRNA(Pro) deacylase)
MTLHSVREFFERHDPAVVIIELPVSTDTVARAAEAHQVEPGRIAKTLAFRLSDGRVFLLVTSGETRIDNRKFKATFGKGRMLTPVEVVELTGHPVGGVCPFGLPAPMPIFLDTSLRKYDEVVPAAGSVNSAVRISTTRLAELTNGEWVDVC